MKINIEITTESIKDFFSDVFESDAYYFQGAFPLKLNGEIIEHFFTVDIDIHKNKVKMTCPNVFARYIGSNRYNDDDFENPRYGLIEVELSEQEKMLFLVGCDAYLAGKCKVLDEQKEGIEIIDPRDKK